MSSMKRKRTLDIFKAGDEIHLLSITKDLFETGFFNCYLTPQQFNLLRILLEKNKGTTIWNSFMKGSLILRFKEDAGDDSNSNENMYMKPGYPTLRNLNATIRYLLYEKAVDYYFCNNPTDVREFQLLESNIDDQVEPPKVSKSLENPDINNKSKSKYKRRNDEDDDYDDDREDDNYEDEEEKEIKDVKITKRKETLTEKKESKSSNKDNLLVDKSTNDYILMVSKEDLLKKPSYPSVPDLDENENSIGKMIHPILGTSSAIESSIEKQNELKLVKNFNKIYHHFENDLPNIQKKRKLERSDKQLELTTDTPEKADTTESDSKQVNKLMTLGGAVNLSLKNLLNRIEENRDKLGATDVELKNLIMDVRKNRSKWANYNKIGQEELYEACERVVTELRGYTEHSTPFLNRVSKRDAPNYYQVIKKPMDLNTVSKKLKTLQYINKTQFVDDLMLIWQNCLTYNSDPKHFIRIDALAMRKKTLLLIPLIPDITVRDRAVVEREAAEKEKEREKEKEKEKEKKKDESEAETNSNARTSNRGVGQKKAKKGRKGLDVESPLPNDTIESVSTPITDGIVSNGTPNLTPLVTNQETPSLLGGGGDDEDAMDIDDEGEDNVGAVDVNNSKEMYAEVEDRNEDADDLEISTWKNFTSNTRYKLCTDRSKLFKDNKIQPNTEATIRTKNQMYSFCKYLEDNSKVVLHRSRNYFEENEDPYLVEYDVAGGVPNIKHPDIDYDKVEEELLEKMISDGKTLEDLPESNLKVKLQGSNSLVLENIGLMQDIRRVCFKINLIRTMQTSQFVHQSQFVAPAFPKIKFEDIDPMSKLKTRDIMTDRIAFKSLQKSVSAIAMASGFQSSTPSCAALLTQIAEVYMCNLAKSLKLQLESNSINKLSTKQTKPLTCKNIIQLVLQYNGVDKPDTLYSYYKEHLTKQNRKLSDLKYGLENFLRDLLRPSMQDISENQFNDDSEQFVNGDFSDEIGEDFFGFKELGLDKEFGLLTSNIPLHLLQSKLSYQFSQMNKHMAKRIYEDFAELELPKLTKRDIPNQIGILQPFYEDIYIKSKLIYNKQLKKYQTQTLNGETPEEPFTAIEDEEDLVMIEDTDLPYKQRNNRPKIPPNGKITQIKKKFVATAFFIEKQDEIEDRLENMVKKKEANALKELEKRKLEEFQAQKAESEIVANEFMESAETLKIQKIPETENPKENVTSDGVNPIETSAGEEVVEITDAVKDTNTTEPVHSDIAEVEENYDETKEPEVLKTDAESEANVPDDSVSNHEKSEDQDLVVEEPEKEFKENADEIDS
ncbi:Transcriptional activator spt7 [Pichia californica]|uniref:SAGA complex subunit Spt7 n=1 Tax=Pichia californica TaxID=460514 RepID=A0A9P7BEW5_9ASCO|nr:Transcriptional activator spt7 [[Candida] californica]